ncbi:Unknown protein sequence [Pseudomonas amygdali pv. sesami]|nr:Unknown protein sequence [Pseudomonas amygdali pv. sesami]
MVIERRETYHKFSLKWALNSSGKALIRRSSFFFSISR